MTLIVPESGVAGTEIQVQLKSRTRTGQTVSLKVSGGGTLKVTLDADGTGEAPFKLPPSGVVTFTDEGHCNAVTVLVVQQASEES